MVLLLPSATHYCTEEGHLYIPKPKMVFKANTMAARAAVAAAATEKREAYTYLIIYTNNHSQEAQKLKQTHNFLPF